MPHVYRSDVSSDKKDDRLHKYMAVKRFAVDIATGGMLLTL